MMICEDCDTNESGIPFCISNHGRVKLIRCLCYEHADEYLKDGYTLETLPEIEAICASKGKRSLNNY